MMKMYDVIVIGGGHAGCEAAHAAARLGANTAMMTLDASKIGAMSCNPAIGGLAKGQLVKEVDALGGVMGRITDLATIQFRRLNSSKGPAVRSSRAQCDKNLYAQYMQDYLKTVPNLSLLEGEVAGLIIEDVSLDEANEANSKKVSRVVGVKFVRSVNSDTHGGSETWDAGSEKSSSGCTTQKSSKPSSEKFIEEVRAKTVIITSGTFLKAVMHRGVEQEEGGRLGDKSAKTLSDDLVKLGLNLRRLKTGTPPRLHKDSIDWSKTTPQPGDEKLIPFSFYHQPSPYPYLPQMNCFLTYTNAKTHEIIEKNLQLSAMYSGAITGVGPRYCPSIEDKISRFRDKDKHQLFLEPEGLDVPEIYVNGISTSLPKEVQEEFVRTIPGLENAVFIRYAYAVEYDAVDARQLKATLECKDIPGLFFAGQVNGTSGYEEAAGQGIIAGINAAQHVLNKPDFTLTRMDAYIGVMIDDLILKGSDEPYRMFTSRAEYRLVLREDNADLRLTPKGVALGLIDAKATKKFENKMAAIAIIKDEIEKHFFFPNLATNEDFAKHGISEIKDRISAAALLRRPEVTFGVLATLGFTPTILDEEVFDQVEIQVKYQGYIERDMQLLEGVRNAENLRIPLELDYETIAGLSNEIRGRLKTVRPQNIGQASRIQGVTPAAVANLMIFIRNQKANRATHA
jgi:tRNA uridine 5-carboxymethylaminomethyl modification enzyme